ncbi:MAG: uridine kinase [Candidatus Marinimicrobia bacterium]|nr:uridine kinase [Candidatus Neomarinimicrobiota bacterium]|tara:strand:+ start:524 stop:1156 length:633 start_codon:yes stop_codon:yes gene_type:complete
MNNKIFIGIAGGTASGKSAIAKHLVSYFNSNICAIIKVDSYYHDLKHLSMIKREKNNFDDPQSIDFKLLLNHLIALKQNKSIHVPIYDYKTHTRSSEYNIIKNQKIIIIEGLFAFYEEKIKNMLNLKAFVDTNQSTRLERRIKRDLKKRKRTYESIIKQFKTMVAPMHNQYIEPTKLYADLIITKGVKNTVAINKLISKIKHMQNNLNKI